MKPSACILTENSGVAALEFALVASALMALVLGAISVGLLWWTQNGLQVTAALTARCAALGSCSNPAGFAVGIAGKWIGTGAVTTGDVTVSLNSPCDNASGNYSNYAKVTITTASWTSILPAPFSTVTPSATACFPIPS